MMDFDIKGLVPRFIRNDKNGHALAKAMEAGLKDFLAVCKQGLDTWGNVEEMPEWRLDEMAWEYNIPYDYTADTEIKREWIRNLYELSRLYGTPEGIVQYMTGYFEDAILEENWEYNGQPYHFRVTVEGEWTQENEAWARKAIAAAKNVRSVLDSLRIGAKCHIGIAAEGKVLSRFTYPLTGAENWAGRWPQENTMGVPGEIDIPAAHAEDTYARILYKQCGQDEI